MRKTALVIFLTVLFQDVSGAQAQSFGQWWWQGEVGFGQQGRNNRLQDREVTNFEQRLLRLALGLNGFIVHPSIADFHLGVNGLLTDYRSGSSVDSDQLGFDARVNVTPKGNHPARLFASRRSFDYSLQDEGDLFLLRSAPDTVTTWGGDLKIRQGLLRGTSLGLNRMALDFLDPEARQQVRETGFLDWQRAGPNAVNRVRFERQLQRYGTVDLEVEDFLLRLDQRINFSPTWRWELTGSARRSDTLSRQVPRTNDTAVVRALLGHRVRADDRLDLRYNYLRSGFDLVRQSHDLSAFYRWRVRPALEVAPFLSYRSESLADFSASTPRVGVRVSWWHEGETIDSRLNGRVGYGTVSRSELGLKEEESNTSYGFTGTIAHGQGWKQEFEFEVSRNELQLVRSEFVGTPDPDLPFRTRLVNDLGRARVTLRRYRGPSSWSGWLEWRRLESESRISLEPQTVDSKRLNIAYLQSFAEVSLEAADSTTSGGAVGGIEGDYLRLGVKLRPLRFLSVGASYRTDRQTFLSGSEVDSDRVEGDLQWQIGAIVVDAIVWRQTQRLSENPDSTNLGFRWTVSRRFAGLLPIATGGPRRGVIR